MFGVISSLSSQLKLPVETITAPNPQSGWADKNLVDSKLLMMPDIMFTSPGGRGQQGPGLTSMTGPQTATDWLYDGVSTPTPVTASPPHLIDSSVPGKKNKTEHPQNSTESFIIDACHYINTFLWYSFLYRSHLTKICCAI